MTGAWAGGLGALRGGRGICVSVATVCETSVFFLSQFSSVCHLIPSKAIQDNCQIDGLILSLTLECAILNSSSVDCDVECFREPLSTAGE